jgi:hypothetical protein
MTALQTIEKKTAEARARMLAIVLLLEEEHTFTTALEAEAVMVALHLAPTTASSSTPPTPSSGGDAIIVAMLHTQACGVQNIRSLVSTVLDSSSTGYAHWRDQVLLTLKRYELTDYVISDDPLVNDLAWDRMETVVLSWIFGMITGELQDITKEHGVVAHQVWHMIEHKFIGNNKTCALHLDGSFHNFVQGDLSVNDYYRKMKSMADSLADLGCTVSDHNLILNILRG